MTLDSSPPETRPPGEPTTLQRERALDAELAEVAGQLNLVNARLTTITEQILESGDWQQAGKTSPAAFLAWKMGLSPANAEHVVRVAERRKEFRVLTEAFDRGEFSLDQMTAAVEAPPWADALIYDFVGISTVDKIRRGMRSNMFDGDPDEPTPEPPTTRDRLSFGVARNGRWRINGEFGIDDGRRIEAALSERRDDLFRDDETVTWPEAFVDCFGRSLGAIESVPRRDHYRTWFHFDVTTADTTTTDGWRIPMAIQEHVLCDGIMQPVWERDGVPFSVGRSQRIVPDRTRRIIEKRDRGCRVPGCRAERFVEIHHIVHWLNGGPTDTWNLLSLCPKHHQMHHQGALGISGNADEFDAVVFTDGANRIRGSGEPTLPTESPPTPDKPYEPPLAGRFDWDWIGLGWVHPNAKKKRLAFLQSQEAVRRAGAARRAAA